APLAMVHPPPTTFSAASCGLPSNVSSRRARKYTRPDRGRETGFAARENIASLVATAALRYDWNANRVANKVRVFRRQPLGTLRFPSSKDSRHE
ncbi:MAG: hypothetical protein KJ000_34065, partial [Pirellulaceae bacterium]|nr:hypothetical protein [Pirellulaceae bacterium]